MSEFMTIQRPLFSSVEEMLEDMNEPALLEQFRDYKRLRDLVDAAHDALDHIDELRDAWQRGVIHETDSKGGTRSNRNVDVQTKLRMAIAANGIDRRETISSM